MNVFHIFQANYVLENDSLLDMQKEEYDVVLALSITKWIHLNWGDDGLKRFFRRIGKQLRSGGILILEAQPWVSYKKKKKLTVGSYFRKLHSCLAFWLNKFQLSRPFNYVDAMGSASQHDFQEKHILRFDWLQLRVHFH
jgi:hypothetical protein